MRRPTCSIAALAVLALGCAGDRRQTQVVQAKRAPFVEWPKPELTEQELASPVPAVAPPEPGCRMWLESLPQGIAIHFEPGPDASLDELRSELRTLSKRLDRLEPLAASEQTRVAAAEEPSDAAPAPSPEDEEQAGPVEAIEPAPSVVERADAEQAAGSLQDMETAAQAADILNAGRVETHGLRRIMDANPRVWMESVKGGARLMFATGDPARVEALRANVRWHAADLLPDPVVDGEPNQCLRLPAPVAAAVRREPD